MKILQFQLTRARNFKGHALADLFVLLFIGLARRRFDNFELNLTRVIKVLVQSSAEVDSFVLRIWTIDENARDNRNPVSIFLGEGFGGGCLPIFLYDCHRRLRGFHYAYSVFWLIPPVDLRLIGELRVDLTFDVEIVLRVDCVDFTRLRRHLLIWRFNLDK